MSRASANRTIESRPASREQQLDACLRQLLNVTELNMDDMEEETREAIRDALCVLHSAPTHGK